MKKSEYKRVCSDCGQKNYREDTKKCGRCGSENMEDYMGMETGVWRGRSTDQGVDFESWETDELKARVKLVKDFDKTCEKAVAAFIRFCMQNKPEEKVVMVPKTVTVAVPNV